MVKKSNSDFIDKYDKIDSLRTEYLSELNSLSKLIVTISIAILGISMSLTGQLSSEANCYFWLIFTWSSLFLSAFFGLIYVIFFSRRFKILADYLFTSHLVDVRFMLDSKEDEVTNEFINKSEKVKNKFKRQYFLCISFVSFQIFFLLASFIFLGLYIFYTLK